MAEDSHGDINVGEVSFTAWSQIYPDTAPPRALRSLRKMVKVAA